MKNAVMVIISAMLGTVILAVVMTMYGRMNRSMEQQGALSSCAEETVENLAVSGRYEIGDTDEYVADFVEALSVQMETDSDITVGVMKMDHEKGVLSVGLLDTFLHPNGFAGTVKSDRTVISDKKEEPEPQEYHVRFFVGNVCYKAYTVYEGDTVTIPESPKLEGGTFVGWKDANDYLADFTQPVTQNMDYFAE